MFFFEFGKSAFSEGLSCLLGSIIYSKLFPIYLYNLREHKVTQYFINNNEIIVEVLYIGDINLILLQLYRNKPIIYDI